MGALWNALRQVKTQNTKPAAIPERLGVAQGSSRGFAGGYAQILQKLLAKQCTYAYMWRWLGQLSKQLFPAYQLMQLSPHFKEENFIFIKVFHTMLLWVLCTALLLTSACWNVFPFLQIQDGLLELIVRCGKMDSFSCNNSTSSLSHARSQGMNQFPLCSSVKNRKQWKCRCLDLFLRIVLPNQIASLSESPSYFTNVRYRTRA